MNVQLKDITVTARDGRVSHLEQVYIRGSHVRFFIVPDMLRCVELPLSGCEGREGEGIGSMIVNEHGEPPLTLSFFLLGMPPCSAAATSAAGVSVSPEEGPQ